MPRIALRSLRATAIRAHNYSAGVLCALNIALLVQHIRMQTQAGFGRVRCNQRELHDGTLSLTVVGMSYASQL